MKKIKNGFIITIEGNECESTCKIIGYVSPRAVFSHMTMSLINIALKENISKKELIDNIKMIYDDLKEKQND